jgi:hypothetical protein
MMMRHDDRKNCDLQTWCPGPQLKKSPGRIAPTEALRLRSVRS